MDVKVVIGTKSGKCVQREVKQAEFFLGKKIGDKFNGEVIDLQGYEFQITGGSDSSGFPMRWDVPGVQRKRILTAKSVGLRKVKFKGTRKRKTMCGNTIHENISQINVKTLKEKGMEIAKGNHGTLSSYTYCHCKLCKKAKREWFREYYKTHKRVTINGKRKVIKITGL